MEWLRKYTFPVESSYKEKEAAEYRWVTSYRALLAPPPPALKRLSPASLPYTQVHTACQALPGQWHDHSNVLRVAALRAQQGPIRHNHQVWTESSGGQGET